MNKEDFAREFAKKGYTIKDSIIITEDFLNTIEELLASGETITFHGFGVFDVLKRKARESKAVRTGETITLPAFDSPRFKAGKTLKRSIREGFVRR